MSVCVEMQDNGSDPATVQIWKDGAMVFSGVEIVALAEEEVDTPTAGDVEALATIIMRSMLASGGINPNTHTVWTDWRPEAQAILTSDWLRDYRARDHQ